MNEIEVPDPSAQRNFFQRLQQMKNEMLLSALLRTVSECDIEEIDKQLVATVPKERIKYMAKHGLRGELAFPVPVLLENNPFLLGYYRLLLGFSQKAFYGHLGFSPFRNMEVNGTITKGCASRINELCKVLSESSWLLISELNNVSKDAINELTLLTVGPQLRGGANVYVGSWATRRVFNAIREIVLCGLVAEDEKTLVVKNASGRVVRIEFSADPDIIVVEKMKSGAEKNILAIEIKGGTDYSNIHNRLGEAEKSHQKAKIVGFVECWTIVGVNTLDPKIAKGESPSTDHIFFVEEICNPSSEQGKVFGELLITLIGLSD